MCSHQVTCSTCCSFVSLCLSLFITDSLHNASHCTHLAFDERLHSTWILLCIRFLLTFLISSSSSRRTISASKQFYFSWAHSSFIAFQPRTHRHRDMHMLALACSALTPISLTKFHMWWYMPFAAFAMPLPAAHRLLVRQAYQLNPLAHASRLSPPTALGRSIWQCLCEFNLIDVTSFCYWFQLQSIYFCAPRIRVENFIRNFPLFFPPFFFLCPSLACHFILPFLAAWERVHCVNACVCVCVCVCVFLSISSFGIYCSRHVCLFVAAAVAVLALVVAYTVAVVALAAAVK